MRPVLVRRRKAKCDKGECAVKGCGKDAETAGFCGACYSSWYRLRDMSMPEIAAYLWKVRRMAERVPLLAGRARKGRRRAA